MPLLPAVARARPTPGVDGRTEDSRAKPMGSHVYPMPGVSTHCFSSAGIEAVLRPISAASTHIEEPSTHCVDAPRIWTSPVPGRDGAPSRSEEHTSELQSQSNLVCRLLLEKKKKKKKKNKKKL